MQIGLRSIGLLLLAATVLRADAAEDAVLTPQHLRDQGIVSLLGRTLQLRAPVMWDYAAVKIPEDPRPMAELARQAGEMRVSFDGPGFRDITARKFFHAYGKELRKVAGADGREIYTFGDTPLVNGQEYVLTVRIVLRPSFTEGMLGDPEFIKQSNNPRYWCQTFALDILAVR